MRYLLDTCILSKLRKINTHPIPKLQSWIEKQPESAYFISVLSVGEIQKGISKLHDKNNTMKASLTRWLESELIPRFESRILNIDIQTSSIWGDLCGSNKTLPVIDSLLAATAIQHHLVLVTENIKDFDATGIHLLNPME